MPVFSAIQKWLRAGGALAALGGAAAALAAPFFGENLFAQVWAVEPLAYIGAAAALAGLLVIVLSHYLPRLLGRGRGNGPPPRSTPEVWGELTRQYFELFNHDLGRPLRRILGKERELRARFQGADPEQYPNLFPEVKELLDEIEGQAPNFRLMIANVEVLVQMEAPYSDLQVQPVEPAEVIRRIVSRYGIAAGEGAREITWWAEPSEFGIIYCDSSAIEHIVTNLVDNSVRYADGRVEIRLTKNPTHFFIRVWDDGPGIAGYYLRHIFDRGWTPEVAKREEKTTSGLGLYIARTLARRNGGELTVESTAEPDVNHHTAFLLALPLRDPPGESPAA